MKDQLKKVLKNKKVISYLAIFFISILICVPLFSKYIDISRDDGIQHICRLIGTVNSFKQGDAFPVIMADFCNGFGYSWNLFYSPLTAYLPLIFKIFTSSFVIVLKLFMWMSIFLSGIFMYQLVYKISKSYKAGIIAAILYMGAPYHLTDLYERIAIAELASFIFLPIVFNGMYDLFRRRNKIPYGIIFGGIGLVLTHNVMALYTAIFCMIYLIICMKKIENKGILRNILMSILIILLCTSFYWIPLLEHYFGTTYEVFLPQRMYKDNTLINSKLTLLELFFIPHYDMNLHVGLLLILGVILIFLYRKKIQNRYKGLLTTFTVFGLTSIVMTLTIFPFEYLPNFLKMLQFPWRMLGFATFFLTIPASIGFAMFLNRNSKKELYTIIFIFIIVSMDILNAKKEVAIPFNEEKYLTPISVTSSTGRVHAGCASFEYLPEKAFKNRWYIEQRKNEVLVLQGDAEIKDYDKNDTDLSFTLEDVSDNTKLELPYIYYLGYQAVLEKQDGTQLVLQIIESDNGFCMITVPNIDKAKIVVSYQGTLLMKFSYISTIIGLLIIGGYLINEKIFNRKK